MLTFDVSNAKEMIISFGLRKIEKIWDGTRVKKIPLDIQNIGHQNNNVA